MVSGKILIFSVFVSCFYRKSPALRVSFHLVSVALWFLFVFLLWSEALGDSLNDIILKAWVTLDLTRSLWTLHTIWQVLDNHKSVPTSFGIDAKYEKLDLPYNHYFHGVNVSWFPLIICKGCAMPLLARLPIRTPGYVSFWYLHMLQLLRPVFSNLPLLCNFSLRISLGTFSSLFCTIVF